MSYTESNNRAVLYIYQALGVISLNQTIHLKHKKTFLLWIWSKNQNAGQWTKATNEVYLLWGLTAMGCFTEAVCTLSWAAGRGHGAPRSGHSGRPGPGVQPCCSGKETGTQTFRRQTAPRFLYNLDLAVRPHTHQDPSHCKRKNKK